MRLKPVPPAPESLEFVADAQRAVPLVPGDEDDCCARLVRRLDLPSRDVAREWLTFLRALGLAEETASGFRRTDAEADLQRLRTAFRERVYLADDVLDALSGSEEVRGDDTEPGATAEETFERVRDRVPEWERSRRRDWEAFWREGVERRLAWAALLGLVDVVADGVGPGDDAERRYRPVEVTTG
ncbi:hypothetical protein ACFO0N_04785 [Halobium salinum]|uniref:Uncharacterized protein n=1 Tax=Halobium salinum TaxID=1364940 RepID=A0ABD5P8P1_9EURY|nr:hypothetical protein [Halobium salinum]